MKSDVLQFQPKPKKQALDETEFWNRDVTIWQCVCECETFFLHQNGEVECQDCALISDTMICGKKHG